MTKAPIGIPIVASVAAFVLVLLALFSGTGHPVFVEQFDIITDLVSKASSSPTATSSGACQDLGGNWLGRACASATAAVGSDVASALDKIEDHFADELAKTLGIKQFYSVHTMNICEGYYDPNATVVGASHNVTNCTAPFAGYNVSAMFDHELSVGPFKLNLQELGFSDDLQGEFDKIYRLLEAFAIIFIIGAGFTGLTVISSIASLFLLHRRERITLLINVILSGIAMGILLLAVTIVTAGAYIAASETNDKGSDVGISATAGHIFTAVTWTAVGLMIVTFVYWLFQHRRFRKGVKRMSGGYRKRSRDSEESYPEPPVVHEKPVAPTRRAAPPPARTDRWGRFHEGISWNSFPSRISFLSNRHSRVRN
ncbi:hypothetical protein GQ53DRAFT_664793 [Thozetella sp. PMI_491]|nr:hypothetical protein GQ53DRAFT_664793 [Thozetella sp. PMI_491]